MNPNLKAIIIHSFMVGCSFGSGAMLFAASGPPWLIALNSFLLPIHVWLVASNVVEAGKVDVEEAA